MQSEGGKKQQQAKVMDLLPIAHQLGCTVAQLAIGETPPALGPAGRGWGDLHLLPRHPQTQDWLAPREDLILRDTQVWVLNGGCCRQLSFFSPLAPAWCLRSEGVSSVLLGVSSAEQLMEHLGALQVSWDSEAEPISVPFPRSQVLAVHPGMGLGGQPLQRPLPPQRTGPRATRRGLASQRCSPTPVSPPRTPLCPSSGSQHVPPPHCLPLQVLSQLTPQTVMEIDGLLGNKPHPKK